MVVEILRGALQGVSNFLTTFFNVIGGSLSSETVSALVGFFFLCLCLRVLDGGVKIPKINRRRNREDDEDEDYEFVVVRRRRRK